MFEGLDVSKRLFISFIECALSGTWTRGELSLNGRSYPVLRAMNQDNCFIDIVAPDGLRRKWQFRLGAAVSIEQSMLILKEQEVLEELAVDDDITLGKKDKPRSTL